MRRHEPPSRRVSHQRRPGRVWLGLSVAYGFLLNYLPFLLCSFLAGRLLAGPAVAMRQSKRMLHDSFEISLELESLELEDLALDLIHILSDPAARSQAEQMLLHDLSDLSLMIEKHCKSEDLLAKADHLVESRVGPRDGGGFVRRC